MEKRTKNFIIYYGMGVVMGILVGVCIGYIYAIQQSFTIGISSDDGKVELGLEILKLIDADNIAGIKRLTISSIASIYLSHIDNDSSQYLKKLYHNSNLVERVEYAKERYPDLIEEIERQSSPLGP